MPENTKSMPILPLRDAVLFPGSKTHLFVGRSCSVAAVEQAMKGGKQVLTLAQRNEELQTTPGEKDLYDVGTVTQILQLLKLPDDTWRVYVEGESRARVTKFSKKENFLSAEIQLLDEATLEKEDKITATYRLLLKTFEEYAKFEKRIGSEVILELQSRENYAAAVDLIAYHLKLPLERAQEILSIGNPFVRMKKMYEFLSGEMSLVKLEKNIQTEVKSRMEKTQRQYYLNEQLKAIQKELMEGEEPFQDELSRLKDKISKHKMPKEVKSRANAELKKLQSSNPISAEASVIRNYLDWLISLPWDNYSKTRIDLKIAEKVLDEDHYGLKKVKERIIEALAVQKRTNALSGSVLCLKGPPGVGKTSLAKSIARATGRKFVRVALGGVRDEAEIRGHRKTYIGSMPGRIMQALRRAKVGNPVILLDEIDKIGMDHRGDPSAALLELLDPEQNSQFNDHYIELDYDLSKVMFICTANSLNLPRPLLDRLEIISISGYTESEKVQIAKNYLIKKQIKSNGLKSSELHISDTALQLLIRDYTREAGVRNLEREIANLCRKTVRKIVSKKKPSVRIGKTNLKSFAGVERYKRNAVEDENLIGITNGLAWTEVGGETLLVEALISPGRGKSILTGKLGDIMKESIHAAQSYVRSKADQLGIRSDVFCKKDVHVHLPEGATPKDGPSAGVAIVTSIVSALTCIPVKCCVAMTGEITLRGRVLPIGGLKEKLLAAIQQGIETVIIPEGNSRDLEEVEKQIRRNLKIITVSHLDQVLEAALLKKPESVQKTKRRGLSIAQPAAEETTLRH